MYNAGGLAQVGPFLCVGVQCVFLYGTVLLFCANLQQILHVQKIRAEVYFL